MILKTVLFLSALLAFKGIQENEPIPTFALEAVSGGVLDSARQLHGKVGVVAFVRLGHPFSTFALEDLKSIHKKRHDDGLAVVAIFSGEIEPKEVRSYVESLDLPFPVLLDPDNKAYDAFGVIAVPSTAFVDQTGKFRFYFAGYRRGFRVAAAAHIDYLLGKISAKEHKDRSTTGSAPSLPESSPGVTRYRMGRLMLADGRDHSAEEQFREAWKLKPPLAVAGIALGFLLLDKGELDEALEVFEDVLHVAPGNVHATGGKALVLLAKGKREEGNQLLQKTLEQPLAHPRLFYEMGCLLEQEGKQGAALEYFKKGLKEAVAHSGPIGAGKLP